MATHDKPQADLDSFQLGVVELPLQVLHEGLLRYLWRPQPVQAQLALSSRIWQLSSSWHRQL